MDDFFPFPLGLINKLCKCLICIKNSYTPLAAKQGNAEERPDASCEIILREAAAEWSLFAISTNYLLADKPREHEGRALVSRQAAMRFSKKTENCA